MKLRPPRLKRMLGVASMLMGAVMMLAAYMSRGDLMTWPRTITALWYGTNGFELSPTDLASTFPSSRKAVSPHVKIYVVPGVHIAAEATRGMGPTWFILGESKTGAEYRFFMSLQPNSVLAIASFEKHTYFIHIHAAWLWALGLPLFFAPVALRWRTRRRERRKGACKKCGYDLAGLPPGEPCPECGGLAERRPAET